MVIDSGASRSITGIQESLRDIRKINSIQVVNAFGGVSRADKVGTLMCMLENNVEFKLENVLFCEKIEGTLVSTKHLISEGFNIHINNKGVHIMRDNYKIHMARYTEGSYVVHGTAKYGHKQALRCFRTKVSNELIHARFGHASNRYIKLAGFPTTEREYCVPCGAAKLSKNPINKKITPEKSNLFIPKTQLEKIHLDTVGPLQQSIEKFRYFVTIVDEVTRYLSIILVSHKSQITVKVIKWIRYWENQLQKRVRCVKSDNGGEFCNQRFLKFTQDRGIKHEKSNPRQPSENGFVERQHRTLIECMRVMMQATDVPNYLWSAAITHAAAIWNSLPRKVGAESPCKQFTKSVPQYPSKRSKLNISTPILYLGLMKDMKAFKVYYIAQKKLGSARDVSVDEIGSLERGRRNLLKSPSRGVEPRNRERRKDKLVKSSSPKINIQSEDLSCTISTTTKKSMRHQNDETHTQHHEKYKNTNTRWEISSTNILPSGSKRMSQQRNIHTAYRVAISHTTLPPKNYFNIQYRADKDIWYAAYQRELQSLEVIGQM